jgi:hypothetical protein
VKKNNTQLKNLEKIMGTEKYNCQKRGEIERYEKIKKRKDVKNMMKECIK